MIGLARGFYSPASSSLNPFLIPKEHFANGATWASSFWQAGAILGPGIAGFLYNLMGLTNTLICVVVIMCIVMTLISTIKKRPVLITGEQKVDIFTSLSEGIRFVFGKKII
jgi:MFS family permease